jgi:hypothetical protein
VLFRRSFLSLTDTFLEPSGELSWLDQGLRRCLFPGLNSYLRGLLRAEELFLWRSLTGGWFNSRLYGFLEPVRDLNERGHRFLGRGFTRFRGALNLGKRGGDLPEPCWNLLPFRLGLVVGFLNLLRHPVFLRGWRSGRGLGWSGGRRLLSCDRFLNRWSWSVPFDRFYIGQPVRKLRWLQKHIVIEERNFLGLSIDLPRRELSKPLGDVSGFKRRLFRRSPLRRGFLFRCFGGRKGLHFWRGLRPCADRPHLTQPIGDLDWLQIVLTGRIVRKVGDVVGLEIVLLAGRASEIIQPIP